MTITTCIFDAYGTLFDVAAAARTAAAEPGRDDLAACWQKLANDWRLKQLQYTWLRAVADAHDDFWDVTQDGLDWAMENNDLADPELRERLLQLYWQLQAYPEVPEMLGALQHAGLNTAILSNGSPAMLDGAVQSAGLGALLDDVLSVESVGVFKPHKSVYDLVGQRFNCANNEVLFVSSNGRPRRVTGFKPSGLTARTSRWTACHGRRPMCSKTSQLSLNWQLNYEQFYRV